jgi:hypothetical protein
VIKKWLGNLKKNQNWTKTRSVIVHTSREKQQKSIWTRKTLSTAAYRLYCHFVGTDGPARVCATKLAMKEKLVLLLKKRRNT